MQWMNRFVLGSVLLCLAAVTTYAQDVPASRLLSSGGMPATGYVPDNNVSGVFAPSTEYTNCAGGALLTTGATGSRCLITFNINYSNGGDGLGSLLRVWNNDNNQQPHLIFDVDRAGFTTAQGLRILQQGCGAPHWMSYCASPSSAQVMLVMADVPGSTNGVVDIYGCPGNKYGGCVLGNRPNLLRLYGQTICCGLAGTEVLRVEDNGHMHRGGTAGPGIAAGSCGTGSSTIAGSDSTFVVTLGTGNPTACTVIFGTAWKSTDITCTFISETDAVGWKFTKAGSANAWTGITLTASSSLTDASKVHGVCVGHM
jgi:hypothetical protein